MLDLTFSGKFDDLKRAYPLLRSCVKKNGFKLNTAKTVYELQNSSQKITGLVVNRHVSVGRKYIRKVERNILNRRSTESINGQISFVQLASKNKASKLKSKWSARNSKQSRSD